MSYRAIGRFGHGASFFNLTDLLFTSYNRPYFDCSFDLNLSHSGECVICAMANAGKVGVDIELVESTDLSSFKNMMTKPEWDAIKGADNPLESFFVLWTQKEAVAKADGRGLNIPLEKIELNDHHAGLEGTAWHLRKIDLGGPYVCHAATDRIHRQIQVKEINPQAL